MQRKCPPPCSSVTTNLVPRRPFLVILVAVAVPLFAGGSAEGDVDASGTGGTAPQGAIQGSASIDPIPLDRLPAAFLGQTAPAGAAGQFTTDFSRATVSYADIISGGPPKDGIPAIDEPSFDSVSEADDWIGPEEAVLVYSYNGETRFYPLQVLMWHEIVNDTVGDKPVAITYCPLCNTGVGFERRFGGMELDFGTTGRLRFSNLIMYDRQTETWWQQASGEAIAGHWAGYRLQLIPVQIAPFGEAAEQWPEALVLNRDTGYNRSYGRNPYVGYDSSERPFLFRGPEIDGEFRLLDRAIVVEHAGEEAVIAYPVLMEERLREVTLGGERIYVTWHAGTASALSADTVAGGRDVGSANAFFARTLEGAEVELFVDEEGVIRDRERNDPWNSLGFAAGRRPRRLQPATAVQHFWFSAQSF